MQVILDKDVSNLGSIGDVVQVKNGYARNFLIPRGFASVANESNKKQLDRKIAQLEKEKRQQHKVAKELSQKLSKASVTISKQVGEEDRIFGAVTTAEVEEALKNEGFKVDKKDISFEEEIKKIGVYQASVILTRQVTAKVKVWVVAAS